MVVELVFVGLVIAAWKKTKLRGVMTTERQKIYYNALEHLKSPTALRKLSDHFEKEGLDIQAKILRKRADYIDAPEDVKKKRGKAFENGLKATDPVKVEALAKAFEKMTATGAAQRLRNHAADLRRKENESVNGTTKHTDSPS